MGNCESERVGAAPARIDKTEIAMLPLRWPLAHTRSDASPHRLDPDETLDIGPKFRKVFGRGGCRITLHRLIDDTLRHGRIHRQRRRLPNQNRAVLAVVFLECVM